MALSAQFAGLPAAAWQPAFSASATLKRGVFEVIDTDGMNLRSMPANSDMIRTAAQANRTERRGRQRRIEITFDGLESADGFSHGKRGVASQHGDKLTPADLP